MDVGVKQDFEKESKWSRFGKSYIRQRELCKTPETFLKGSPPVAWQKSNEEKDS